MTKNIINYPSCELAARIKHDGIKSVLQNMVRKHVFVVVLAGSTQKQPQIKPN